MEDEVEFALKVTEVMNEYPGDFSCITIYDNPSDDPGNFVARLFINIDNVPTATTICFKAKTLEAVQKCMKNSPFVFTLRQPEDDPIIVGTWI